MTDKSPASFRDFWRLGYKRLVPIIPHDADISERSSLFKRVGTNQDSRGKAVGIRGHDGRWFGFDWLPHEADEADIERWQRMGAGIGIKTGQGLIAIDADTTNEDCAKIIRDTVQKHFGKLPARVGRYPKVLYPCRVSEPLRYMRVEFGEWDDQKKRLLDRIEVLSDGRQFVAHGIHPGTRKPYTWPRELNAFEDLPVFPAASVVHFLEELRALLPNAKPLVTEGAAADVDQKSLHGRPEKVAKAVALIPNTSEHFPTRESYRDFGYAIKAALPDDEAQAFDIFAEWCGRWKEGENDPAVVEADWRRMKPPFRRGANWLYELAEQHAPKQFDRTEIWFEPVTEADNPFAPRAELNALESQEPVEIKWVNPAEWHGKTPPPRKWIVAGMVPDGEVTLITGAGGVGKTLLAQQMGTCISKGLPFLGLDSVQGNVMAFLCEDSEDELHIRQADINAALCLDMNDIAPHLRIASRKYMDNLLVLWDRNTGQMKRQAVFNRLVADAIAFKAKVVIVDTIADTFGGSEIDRAQVRQFIQSCLGRLAQAVGGAVIALGHPSKAGQAVGGDGTSGSTAWHASVRSRLYLEHTTKDASGPFRKLSNKKANYGPAGDQFVLRWQRGAFELVTAKMSAPARAGEGAGASFVPDMASAIDAAIIDAVVALAKEGRALSLAKNSPYWAPKAFRASFPDTLGLYGIDDVEAGLSRALEAGRVREAIVGRKYNRQPVTGLVVSQLADALLPSRGTPAEEPDEYENDETVFD